MRRILLFTILVLTSLAFSQAYIASEGFGRPQRFETVRNVPSIGVTAEQEHVAAYWNDTQGIMRQYLNQENSTAERVLEQRFVRDLQVLQVQGESALAWVTRERESEHWLRWQDEDKLILSDLAPRPFTLGSGPDGPVVLYSRRVAGVTSLILWWWTGEEATVHEAAASISGLGIAVGEDGTVHMSWLQKDDLRDDWDAYYTVLAPDDRSSLVHLGPAVNRGLTDLTYIGLADDDPVIMWPYETLESRARRAFGAQATGSWAVATVGERVTIQPIAPLDASGLGFHEGYAYWAEGAMIYRQSLEEPEGAPRPLVWSPGLVERGDHTSLDGTVYLLWYGPQQGGGYALYTADTRVPFQPGWRDEVARWMRWNPWRFWEALSVQTFASLIIGIVATLLFVPVFWAGGLLMARSTVAGGGATGGIIIGFSTLLLMLLLMRVVPSSIDWLTILPQFLVSVAVAMVVAWLLSRRFNVELPMQVLAAAAITTSVTLSILTFLNFSYLGL